eukprot:3720258-Alexandrium_andersonii.AAC.1
MSANRGCTLSGRNSHSQFAASSTRNAFADPHSQVLHGTCRQLAAPLADSTRNSQRVSTRRSTRRENYAWSNQHVTLNSQRV